MYSNRIDPLPVWSTTASTPTRQVLTRFAKIIVRRRSMRSANAPTGRAKSSHGRLRTSSRPATRVGDRVNATAAQAKALGSAIRLRILRLCLHDELTNQQLAARLECDPSTLHYHARILLDTGFLERADPRHGSSGALEKPYRSTGLSWTLDIDIGIDDADATLAMVDPFRAELVEAGSESVESSSRFVLHLDEVERDEMMRRIQVILDEYEVSDDERRAHGRPRLGGVLVLHQLVNPD